MAHKRFYGFTFPVSSHLTKLTLVNILQFVFGPIKMIARLVLEREWSGKRKRRIYPIDSSHMCSFTHSTRAALCVPILRKKKKQEKKSWRKTTAKACEFNSAQVEREGIKHRQRIFGHLIYAQTKLLLSFRIINSH